MNPLCIIPVIVHDRRRFVARNTLFANLLHQLRGMDPDATRAHGRVFMPIVSDAGSGIGPWTGMKAALLRACYSPPPENDAGVRLFDLPTHVLLLEDDADPGLSALEAAATIAAWRPNDAVYLSATREQAGDEMDAAAAVGRSYAFVTERVVGSVAVLLPVPMARRFLRRMGNPATEREFLDTFRHGPETAEAGDARLWWFLTNIAGQAQVVTAWSIFGHGLWAPNQSLVPRKEAQAPRCSYRTVAGVGEKQQDAEHPCAIDVDWSIGADLDSRAALDRPGEVEGCPAHADVLAER